MLHENLPPSESCNSLVNLESRYGTCKAFLDLSPKADITLPRASRPQFIDMPSFALSPVAPGRKRQVLVKSQHHRNVMFTKFCIH